MDEAAGYIVFFDAPAGRQFLLLRNARHGSWGFPKGHLERGENAQQAATRELAEETAITHFEPLADCVIESVYRPRFPGKNLDEEADIPEKRVRYFVAGVPSARFKRSAEHDAGGWMQPEEVLALLGHEDLRRVFRDALKRLAAR